MKTFRIDKYNSAYYVDQYHWFRWKAYAKYASFDLAVQSIRDRFNRRINIIISKDCFK